MKVYVFLTTGFEEIEALGTVDVLRRAEVDVKTVSITGERTVVGAHQIPVVADMMFDKVEFNGAEMLVLPGGTPKINDHEPLRAEVKKMLERGKKVAAICAAPMVLGTLGLLKGRRATAYPGFEQYLEGAILETESAVVVDGNIITGKGPGFTLDFAVELVKILKGEQVANQVAKGLLIA